MNGLLGLLGFLGGGTLYGLLKLSGAQKEPSARFLLDGLFAFFVPLAFFAAAFVLSSGNVKSFFAICFVLGYGACFFLFSGKRKKRKKKEVSPKEQTSKTL